MSEREISREIKNLEKKLKGETDLNVVLEIWGKINFLCKLLQIKCNTQLNKGDLTYGLKQSSTTTSSRNRKTFL